MMDEDNRIVRNRVEEYKSRRVYRGIPDTRILVCLLTHDSGLVPYYSWSTAKLL
jgi:hypothetical protein